MENKNRQDIEVLKHFAKQHQSSIKVLEMKFNKLRPSTINISIIQLIATLALIASTVVHVITLILK